LQSQPHPFTIYVSKRKRTPAAANRQVSSGSPYTAFSISKFEHITARDLSQAVLGPNKIPAPMTPQEFVAKWRGSTSTEKQAYQQHFLDLCNLVGHPTPAQLDPENKFFTFEAGAVKQSGGQGWADVWFKGHFAIEYKGPHGDLDKAYTQLLQYRESLDNPPLLIVSNIQSLVIHTNFTGTAKKIVTITLDDLLQPAGLQNLRNVFYNPKAFRPEKTAAQVTEEAAARFGRLAAHLAKWGYSPHDVAHYLIRLLFCLFSEDIDLLPLELFTRMVESGRRNPAGFNRQVKLLFHAMAEGDYFGEHQIRYFDGSLFDDEKVLDMDGDGVAILHGITQLDWSSIEPAILGTLFTRSLDPSKRAQLGAHYTSREDILLIVEPVLMAPLRREWAEIKEKAKELAQKRNTAPTRAVATRLQNELSSLILGFAEKLARVRVLDPACGSGNFLYVSLRLLLELWKEVSVFASEVGLSLLSPLPGLSPSPLQLYGIEINDYAHELAQATVWIGYLQWLHGNGFGLLDEPILKLLDNIKHMDAILAHDADGQPVEPEWQEADVIVGNPPFLGSQKMRTELGEEYVRDLRRLFADRIPGQSDLVCYWFERARHQIELRHHVRAGLLATNSIRGGANRVTLERIKETGDIFFAYSNRDWILEGAAVNISIVGFDNGKETTRSLDGAHVGTINADLTPTNDLTVAAKLTENTGLSFQGPVKVGPFDIDAVTAIQLMSAENASGVQNQDVIRPIMNASDIVKRPSNRWLIDFGDATYDDARAYQAPFAYVLQHVKPVRDTNSDNQRRTFWWRLGRSGNDYKDAALSYHRVIFTPRVAKHRVFVWAENRVMPDSAVVAITRDDDYFFGVLHSKPHELWSLRMGTSLEDRPRYTPTTTFETYPFPWPPGNEPQDDPRVQAIAEAAKELVKLRDAWLNPPGLSEKELQRRTLTNLYNQRPDWLDQAHKKLDAAVFDAYGWPHDLSDEEILARLLALNLERA
jgi:type II restriction/modification system DNA methylase subunit YeeA